MRGTKRIHGEIDVRRIALDCGIRLGEFSLALLFSFSDFATHTINIITDRRLGFRGRLEKASEVRSLWDYMEEIHNYKPQQVYVSVTRLRKKGLIRKRGRWYELTARGHTYIDFLKRGFKKKADQMARWDGKFRLVTFDIPESQRRDRTWLTAELLALDFIRLQKSVFVGKYPIAEDVFQEMKRRDLIRRVRLLTVGEIDDELFSQKFG